jgi:hypothetical protein
MYILNYCTHFHSCCQWFFSALHPYGVKGLFSLKHISLFVCHDLANCNTNQVSCQWWNEDSHSNNILGGKACIVSDSWWQMNMEQRQKKSEVFGGKRRHAALCTSKLWRCSKAANITTTKAVKNWNLSQEGCSFTSRGNDCMLPLDLTVSFGSGTWSLTVRFGPYGVE